MKIGATACLLLTACSAPLADHYTVYLDPSVSDPAEVLSSMDDWSSRTGGGATFSVVYGAPDRDGTNEIVVRGATTDEIRSVAADRGPIGQHHYVGFTIRDDGLDRAQSWIPTNDPSDLPEVIRHEIGHAMGLAHSGPGTVMFHDANGASRSVTCADAEQWAELRRSYLQCTD